MNFRTVYCLLTILAASCANAAVITYAGFVEDATVPEWRTATTAKPMDIDGNNIYGSHGAVAWTYGQGPGEQPQGSTNPGWAYHAEVTFGQFSNPGYVLVDDWTNPTVDTLVGIGAVRNPGLFKFELTGDASTYAGRTVRMGIMADVLTAAEAADDHSKTFQLVQNLGGDGSSPVISLRNGDPGDHVPEMYFFDITGVNANDRFLLIAGNSPVHPGYAGFISWDLSPIPEPGSAALVALAGIILLTRRSAAVMRARRG